LAVTCCSPCATIQEYHQLSKTTYPIHPEINQWGTGMFDCQEDGYMCTKGAICPCMVSADALAEMGAPWFCLCMCPIGCAARTLIRETYNIPGSFFKDFLTYAIPPSYNFSYCPHLISRNHVSGAFYAAHAPLARKLVL
jgi:Cys-rich protein (TIGR01571 family)